jgi:hypothetical protein
MMSNVLRRLSLATCASSPCVRLPAAAWTPTAHLSCQPQGVLPGVCAFAMQSGRRWAAAHQSYEVLAEVLALNACLDTSSIAPTGPAADDL